MTNITGRVKKVQIKTLETIKMPIIFPKLFVFNSYFKGGTDTYCIVKISKERRLVNRYLLYCKNI